MHISFTPTDKSKPPIEIVFVDASGEHSEEAFHSRDKNKSGMLPNYLTAILESNVKPKLPLFTINPYQITVKFHK